MVAPPVSKVAGMPRASRAGTLRRVVMCGLTTGSMPATSASPLADLPIGVLLTVVRVTRVPPSLRAAALAEASLSEKTPPRRGFLRLASCIRREPRSAVIADGPLLHFVGNTEALPWQLLPQKYAKILDIVIKL